MEPVRSPTIRRMSLTQKSRSVIWVLGPIAVAAALLVQVAVAARIGLLPFDQSFAAGRDGEWLTLLATITGLAGVTSALGGLTTSGLLRGGLMMRVLAIGLAAVAGLSAVPFLHRLAGEARDVELAAGGPRNSVTAALIIGLGMGALAAAVISAFDWRAVGAGLAVTLAGLWVLAVVSTSVAVGVPPLGLPNDLLRTSNALHTGGWFPLPAVPWIAIGAASALTARRFTAARSTALLSGIIGALIVSLSYFTARPKYPYLDHTTVQSSAIAFTITLVGGALVGTILASLVPVRGPQGAHDSVAFGKKPRTT